jgi:hypothetical protein
VPPIRLSTAAACAAVLCATQRASAADEPSRPLARLEFVRDAGAEACPDELALRNAVADRLGSDPFWPAAARAVSVLLDRDGRRFRARVILRDAASGKILGTRVLTSAEKDCTELFAALSLAVSIAVDPESATRAPRSDPSPSEPSTSATPPESAATHPAPAPPDAPPPPVDAPSRAPTRPFVPRILGGAMLALGTSPEPEPGFRLGGSFAWARFAIDIEARADAPVAPKSFGRDGELRTYPVLFGAMPCARFGALSACASGHVGFLHGSSSSDARARVTVLAAVGTRVAVEVPARGRLFTQIHTDVMVPLTPTHLLVHGRTVWSVAPVAEASGLAAGVRF